MNGLLMILGILLIFLSVFLLNEALGQSTSLNNYNGAYKDDTKEKDITELNICAKYTKGCDTVPQNTPIPRSMIPFTDNKAVVTGAIYT